LSGVAFSFPRQAEVVEAGGKGRSLFDRVFEEGLRLVELLLFQRVDALEDEQLRLREMRSKVVQAVEFVQLFVRSVGLAFGSESDAESVVSFFEVGFQFDGFAVRGNRARIVAAGFQLHAEVVLRFRVVRIDRDSFAKFRERCGVVALAAQRDPQNGMCAGELGVESDRSAKLGGG